VSVLDIATPRAFLPLLQPARYKGAHGGRAGAKSHFFGGLWLEENVARKVDTVCLREVQKSLDMSVRKLLVSKIVQHNAGAYFDVYDKKLVSKHGGMTVFQGLQDHTAESIKSLEGFDRAWIEEGQNVGQLSLDLLRPTIRKPGSQIWASWNPKLATDPIDAFLRDTPNKGRGVPAGAVVVEVTWRDNPYFSAESRADMEYDWAHDPEKASWIWDGKYLRNTAAQVFKRWRVEEFDVDPAWTLRQGADWGFSIDPSVLVQCAIVGRRLYVIAEAYKIGCEIDDLPQLFDEVPDSRLWATTADSARPETISYMRRKWSERIAAALKGARSLEEGVEFLQSFEIVVHPRCKHTIDEMTSYSFKVDKLTDEVLPVLADKDNHVIDALRYACEAARRAMRAKEQNAGPPPSAPIPMVSPFARR
jgi:phage terminase large subunit